MAKKIELEVGVKGGETVEKAVNAYSNLTKQIKQAKGELAALSDNVGSDAYKKAAANLNELQEKLGDVQDAAKITGNGFERIQGSFNLFKEGLATADFGKAKTAFTALKGAMDALPIFLLIEGVKLLIDNFDEVVKFVESFTDAAKEQEKTLKGLAQAYDDINTALQEIDFYQKEYVRNTEQNNALLIEKAKQKGAKDKELAQLEIKGLENKLNIFKKAEENYRQQKLYAESVYYKALETNDEEAIKKAKESLENATSAYKSSVDARKDLSNQLQLTEAKNLTETLQKQKDAAKEYKKNQEDINKVLAGLRIESLKDAQQKETELLNQKFNDLKKELSEKKASKQQLEELEKRHIEQLLDINAKYTEEKLNKLRKSGDDIEKANVENGNKIQKAEHDLEIKILNEKLAFTKLKGERTYTIDRQILLKKHEDELELLNNQKKEDLEIASKLKIGADDKKLEIEEKYAKLSKDIKERQYLEEEELLKKSIDGFEKSQKSKYEKLKRNLDEFNKYLQQFSSYAIGVWDAIDKLNDAKLEARLFREQTALDELKENRTRQQEEELAASQAHYDELLQKNKDFYNAQLENENLTAEEKKKIQEAQAQDEQVIKINAENAKIAIDNAAKQEVYDAELAFYEESEKLKEEAFKQDQNMKIAQITISTISGAIAAFTSFLEAFPAPYNFIAGGIAAAAVAAMGGIQIAAVQATKYQKGKAPSKPSFQKPSNVGNAVQQTQIPTSASTPKDTTLYATGGGGTPFGGTGMQQKQTVTIDQNTPIKTYVLTSDVSSALAAEEALKRKVTGF